MYDDILLRNKSRLAYNISPIYKISLIDVNIPLAQVLVYVCVLPTVHVWRASVLPVAHHPDVFPKNQFQIYGFNIKAGIIITYVIKIWHLKSKIQMKTYQSNGVTQ